MPGNVATLEPFVSLVDVEVTYPNGTRALKPLSLTLHDDQLTVLLGPSGAGKSTLLRLLNFLVEPTQGEVQVRGVGTLKRGAGLRQHRRETGMVFQQHQLIGRLTALQNVLIGRIGHYHPLRTLWPMSESEQNWALDCLERVDVFDKALVRCDALSGGQQQRVGIARALAQRPRMILADEPVASLDPTTSERVLALLAEICRQERIPAVVSLHQLEYARAFADRIIGLAHGEVVYDGAADGLNDEVLTQIYGANIATTGASNSSPLARVG